MSINEMSLFDDSEVVGDFSHRTNLTNKEMQQINLAKRIRQAVASKNFSIDESHHRNNTNKILYDFVRLFGMTPYSFALEYLSTIQPYCIASFDSQNYGKSIRCVIDPTYKIPLYVKIDFTQHNECLISFHETQKHTISQFKGRMNDYIIIIPDWYDIIDRMSDLVYWKAIIFRGFRKFNISGRGYLVKDGIIKANHNVIEDVFEGYIKDTLSTISRARITLEKVKYTDYTFTSYGDYNITGISLLFDYYSSDIDKESKDSCVYILTKRAYNMRKSKYGRNCLSLFIERLGYIRSSAAQEVSSMISDILETTPERYLLDYSGIEGIPSDIE